METEYLARYNESEDLYIGIQILLSDDHIREKISIECQELVEREYLIGLQASCYIELYTEVLEVDDK